MKMQEVREIAKGMNIKTGTMKKAELIQTIQRAEGNEDCYDRNKSDSCGQEACCWKEDCK